MDDPRMLAVTAGYDRITDRYGRWVAEIDGDPRERMLAELTRRLPRRARLLELGCGQGVPSTKSLAERFDVTGIDASAAQLERARANVPGASFVLDDFTKVDLPAGSFDAVVALYSISHVPRDEHGRLFEQIDEWLVPGGLFLASLGVVDSPDWTGPWLGVPMFFSSFDADANRELLRSADFELLLDEVVEMHEPEGPASFLWVLAQRP